MYRHLPPLPGLTKEGYRVSILRGLDKTVLHPSPYDLAKIILMIGDVRLEAEEVGVAGDVYILDADVATTSHLAKVTPTMIKQFLVCVQVRMPHKNKKKTRDFNEKLAGGVPCQIKTSARHQCFRLYRNHHFLGEAVPERENPQPNLRPRQPRFLARVHPQRSSTGRVRRNNRETPKHSG